MEAQARTRLHPLVAGAAVAVIVAGGVAVAAITGYLPGSKAEMAPEKAIVSHPAKPAQQKQHVAAACHDCGVIVEVKAVDVPGKGSGIGAVAGGVAAPWLDMKSATAAAREPRLARSSVPWPATRSSARRACTSATTSRCA